MLKLPRNLGIIVISVLMIGLTAAAYASERLSIKSDRTKIRSGPGAKFEILFQVDRFYPIRVLKKDGSWIQFSDFEKDIGWVNAVHTEKTETVIVNKRTSNVRSGPSSKFDIIFKAKKGVAFKVLNRQGNWIMVQHSDGDVGWIYKTLVW